MSKKELTLGYMKGTGQVYPFDSLYKNRKDVLHQGIEGIDALVVWGGTDIHPSYYNQKAHKWNEQYGTAIPINRDIVEWRAMKWAKANNVPIIGVCRGAQMACAFAGGSLIQHVSNHNSGEHQLYCEDSVIRTTNSVHHQMMYPYGVDHRLIAWARGHSDTYEDGYGDMTEDMKNQGFKEPEIVYFPGINALAIQGHPEWMAKDSDFVQYCLELVQKEFLSEDKEEATDVVAVEASVNE